MKKSLIALFAILAAVLLICGIHAMNCCDVLELQHNGVSYADALKMEANCRVQGYYLNFFSFLCACAAFGVSRAKSI